jgi:DNA-binding MarR family transcriptional regulator
MHDVGMPSKVSTDLATTATAQLPREESLGYQVNHLARLLESALRVRIAQQGVLPGVFPPLLALFEHDGLSQSELSSAVHIDQSTMALTVRRMERDGLVTRSPSRRDKRQTEVWLTEHARELRSTLIGRAIETNSLATQGVSDADLATVHQVLTQMIANLQYDSAGQTSSRVTKGTR